LVDLLGDVALELKGGGEDVVIDAEWIAGDEDHPGFLKTVEFTVTAQSGDFLHDDFYEGRILIYEHFLGVLAVCFGPLIQLIRLGYDDAHAAVSQ